MKKSIAFLAFFVGLVSLTTGQDCQRRYLPDGFDCSSTYPHVNRTIHHTQIYPDSQQCSRYWQCEKGCAILVPCDAGTFYDVVTGQCLPPSEAQCAIKKCPHQGYFPDEKNCRKYYYCDSSLKPHHHNCLNILGMKFLFDVDKNDCFLASFVDCKARPICNKDDSDCRIQHPTTRATTKQTITTTVLPTTTTTEPVTTKPTTSAQTTTKRATTQPTPTTTTTKPHTTTTTEPVTTKPTTTSKQTTVRPSFGTCNEEFGFECQPGQYKAMERCSPFYCQCGAAGWVKKSCPDSLVFDQQIHNCNFPSSTSCN